jgi:hypothetical protein
MVERAQYILKRKSVNGGDTVVDIFTAKTDFPEPALDFIGRCVGVRNAGYPPG